MKTIMMGNQATPTPSKSSALATHGSNLPSDNNQLRRGGKSWCDHCRKPGHTKDTSRKVHAKLSDWKPRVSTESRDFKLGEEKSATETKLFSKEQNCVASKS